MPPPPNFFFFNKKNLLLIDSQLARTCDPTLFVTAYQLPCSFPHFNSNMK